MCAIFVRPTTPRTRMFSLRYPIQNLRESGIYNTAASKVSAKRAILSISSFSPPHKTHATAAERIRHTQDKQDRILAMAFRLNSLLRCIVLNFFSEADLDISFARILCRVSRRENMRHNTAASKVSAKRAILSISSFSPQTPCFCAGRHTRA